MRCELPNFSVAWIDERIKLLQPNGQDVLVMGTAGAERLGDQSHAIAKRTSFGVLQIHWLVS